MSATTDILPFATGIGANVETQASYLAAATTSSGYAAGLAQSALCNKTWRQSGFMAAGLANFCVAQGISIPDDGNLSGLVINIQNALENLLCTRTNNLGDLTNYVTARSNLGLGSAATYAYTDFDTNHAASDALAFVALNYLALVGGTLTGNMYIRNSAAGHGSFLYLDGPSGVYRGVTYTTGNINRFFAGINTEAELGSDSGGNFVIIPYHDDGTQLSPAVHIDRFGVLTLSDIPFFPTALVNSGDTQGANCSYADRAATNALNTAETYAAAQDVINLASAKAYSVAQDVINLASAKSYADVHDSITLASAGSYTDSQVVPERASRIIGDQVNFVTKGVDVPGTGLVGSSSWQRLIRSTFNVPAGGNIVSAIATIVQTYTALSNYKWAVCFTAGTVGDTHYNDSVPNIAANGFSQIYSNFTIGSVVWDAAQDRTVTDVMYNIFPAGAYYISLWWWGDPSVTKAFSMMNILGGYN